MEMSISSGRECHVTLVCQGMSIRDLVKDQVETSNKEDNDRHFYMCDLGDIIGKYQNWMQLMPRVKPFYAVKCNDDIPVLKVLADLGASFDCASKSEIEKVLGIGVSPTRIIYAHPCKQPSMLSFAEQKDVGLMTFDNAAELHKVNRIYPSAMLVLRIAIISAYKGENDFSRKFGSQPSEVPSLLQTAKELGLNVIGISFHVGSNCWEPRAFSVAIQQARQAFDIGNKLGFRMRLLDIGGGFPGDFNTHETFQKITAAVNQSLQKLFPAGEGVEIIAEPGRYMVASACTIGVNIIAKRVISTTANREREDDTSSNSAKSNDTVMYYVNDGVYGSFLSRMFEIKNFKAFSLKSTAEDVVLYESSVWGPSCDGDDVIVESTKLPLHEVGEWLYFQNMGAYALTTTTKFNGMDDPRRFYYCPADSWYKLYPEKKAETLPCTQRN